MDNNTIDNKKDKISLKSSIFSETDTSITKKYEATIKDVIEKQPKNTTSKIKLEYSTFFRYPKDTEIISSFIEKKILAGDRTSLLEIGVGNLQELFSYLAAIKKMADLHNKTLEECLGVEIVELCKKESINMEFSLKKPYGIFRNKNLFENSQSIKPPKEYASSFYFDEKDGVYKFSFDIQEYVNKIISNKNTAHFSTSIEDYLIHSKNQTDIVACNNVLQYLGGFGVIYSNPLNKDGLFNKDTENIDITKFQQIVKGIIKRVKDGGLLIMHVDTKKGDIEGSGAEAILNSLEGFLLNFTKISSGIYQRNITDDIKTAYL